MPPKPQVFKSPDGREFNNKAEWRDYMMLTFFSYKNKVDEPEPLIRLPGSIEGQMYDIADCQNSTLVVLDHSEQVQIDECKNCRIFIAACASSIFIRNCENCTFYTCCRQLRLRDVVNCKFYIYSMAEVHIEFSKGLQFAPFNGGYPEHEKHLKMANLDINHNLWYDIYDHNDSAKTRVNWSLLPESEYEAPWFPAGTPCTPAIALTKPGGVFNANSTANDANMQSFSLEQMRQDAEKLKLSAAPAAAPPAAPAAAAVPPPLPAVTATEVAAASAPVPAPAPAAPAAVVASTAPCCGCGKAASTADEKIKEVLGRFVAYKAGDDISAIAHASFSLILANGQTVSLQDMSAVAPVSGSTLGAVERLHVCPAGHTAYATFWAVEGATQTHNTAVLQKESEAWVVMHVQKSAAVPATA